MLLIQVGACAEIVWRSWQGRSWGLGGLCKPVARPRSWEQPALTGLVDLGGGQNIVLDHSIGSPQNRKSHGVEELKSWIVYWET